MEISEEEKKYVYPIIVIGAIILIFVLVLIWKPNKKSTIEENINKVSVDTEYDAYQQERYLNLLNNLLMTSNFNNLYDKIDSNWIANNNFNSKEDVRTWLFKNGIITSNKINIVDSETYFSKNIYVFKYTIENNGERKDIIINESKPNIYTISFEQGAINALSNREYTYTSDMVTYNIKVEYVDKNLIQYEIEIKNDSEDRYEWIMNNPLGTFLELDDNEQITAANITTFANSDIFIESGSTFKFKINFNVSLDKQSRIKDIRFTDVYKNGVKNGAVILLKGSES